MTSASDGVMTFRRTLAPLVGAAMCVAFMPSPDLTRTTPILEHYVAHAIDVDGGGKTPINIYIERWSSDEDMDRLRTALPSGNAADLLAALGRQPRRAGVILMPGVQGHGARVRTRTPKNILLARSVNTPSGRRVVLASAEHLGFGEPAMQARESFAEFNLIEIRFARDGTGVGKVASVPDVAIGAPKLVEVKNFQSRPATLVDVRLEKR
jgi:hypothetical protein